MKNQFEQTRLIADNLSACDLAILRFANFVWDALLRQFLFVASNGGDFGDCINAIWKKFWRALGWDSESMTRSETSLFHGG